MPLPESIATARLLAFNSTGNVTSAKIRRARKEQQTDQRERIAKPTSASQEHPRKKEDWPQIRAELHRGHDAAAQLERHIALSILHGVANFVGHNAQRRHTVGPRHAPRKHESLAARIIVIRELPLGSAQGVTLSKPFMVKRRWAACSPDIPARLRTF